MTFMTYVIFYHFERKGGGQRSVLGLAKKLRYINFEGHSKTST